LHENGHLRALVSWTLEQYLACDDMPFDVRSGIFKPDCLRVLKWGGSLRSTSKPSATLDETEIAMRPSTLEKMFFVGVTERMTRLLRCYSRVLGGSPLLKIPRLNRHGKKEFFCQPKIAALLDEYTQLDRLCTSLLCSFLKTIVCFPSLFKPVAKHPAVDIVQIFLSDALDFADLCGDRILASQMNEIWPDRPACPKHQAGFFRWRIARESVSILKKCGSPGPVMLTICSLNVVMVLSARP